MNSAELGILSRSLGCVFRDASWRPYHQYNHVEYKTTQISLKGYVVVISVWKKKTTFKVMNVKGEPWFSFNVENEYSLYLWSKEQVGSYLLQQIDVQRTKEMFSDLAFAKLENSNLMGHYYLF